MAASTDSQTKDSKEELQKRLDELLLQKQVKDAEKALEDAPKVENPQLKQLQNTSEIVAQQKTIAENQKAIAEAQKATILATFPKGTTTPLEGEIKTDDKFGYMAIPVAYQAIKDASKPIVDEINKLKTIKPKILIVSEIDFAIGDVPVFQIESGIDLLEKRLSTQMQENDDLLKQQALREQKLKLEREKAVTEAIGVAEVTGGALAAVGGIVSTISDIIGYFQVDYNIKGQNFTIDNQAIQSIIAGQIDKEIEVYIYNFGMIEKSDIIERFTKLLHSKKKLEDSIELIKSTVVKKINDDLKTKNDAILKLETKIANSKLSPNTEYPKTLKVAKDAVKPIAEWLESANTVVNNSESLSKAILTFAESVTKSPDEKTLPLLVKAALRKQIGENKISHLLNLKVLSSGGEAMTLKSRLSSGKTAFIGGGVISFVLATTQGKVLASNIYPVLAQLDYSLSDNDARIYQNVLLIQQNRKLGRIKWFKKWLNL